MASRIREVWADNLDVELVALREALDLYPVVSMFVPSPALVLARTLSSY
jgi:CCR4-NOT transcription complex subunit 7/8